MKITISRKELVEVLNNSVKVVNLKSPLKALHAIKIAATEDSITIEATDLDTTITQKVAAQVIEPEEIILPYKAIDLIRKLEDEFLTIEASSSTNHAYVIAGKTKTFFTCPKVSDFPQKIKVQNATAEIQISGKDLKSSISKVSYAVSADISRLVFTGILFDISPSGVKLIATDTFRLAVTKADASAQVEAKHVVPFSIVKLLPAISGCENITMVFSQNTMFLKADNTEIVTRLLDGGFPPYQKLIPEKAQLAFTVNTNSLNCALERAKLFTAEHHAISFKIKEGALTLVSGEGTAKYTEEMPVNIISGSNIETVEVFLNDKFTQESIKSIESEETEISFSSATTPAIIAPHGDDKHFAIIVPVRMGTTNETAA